jgi:hypothetical protein
MDKVIIFGTAGTGQKLFKKIKNTEDVLCFSDNNEKLWGTELEGKKIVNPNELVNMEFDFIHVASMCGLAAITEQLVGLGIPRYKMKNEMALVQTKSRVLFLENFAKIVYERDIAGEVAEAGVYKGDFSREINRCFPDRKLYLFDTFEGFTETDISEEKEASHTTADYLKDTSVELVISKMPVKDKCIVKKGFFPDTAVDVDEKFAFVSLDMDLYKPTLEGLRYFYPKMSRGGIIAIHDFFSDAYPNIKQSVYEYEEEIGNRLCLVPVGDDISIAIVKP